VDVSSLDMTDTPYVFLKKARRKRFIELFPHSPMPILFAEVGHKTSYQGRRKKGLIVVDFAGLRMSRSVSSLKAGIDTLFVPTYDVERIRYIDRKRRELVTPRGKVAFSCSHADEAVACIVRWRRALFPRGDRRPIELIDFPEAPSLPDGRGLVNENDLAMLSYRCACERYNEVPDGALLSLFQTPDSGSIRSLVLSAACKLTSAPGCVVEPILQLGRLEVVRFRGFAPRVVCRVAHFLLKRSSTINTVVFDSYAKLEPVQLRMQSIRNTGRGALSMVFRECRLAGSVMVDLIKELARFPGEFQRLSFNAPRLTKGVCQALLEAMMRARCFRTLEVLEFDRARVSSVSHESVADVAGIIVKRCRFIQVVSLSMRSPIMGIPLSSFNCCNTLTEIVLMKHDMSRYMGSFEVPPSVHRIDLSHCIFGFESLHRLLENLVEATAPLTLGLASLDMPAADWEELFAFWHGGPPPIDCIRELDWSGNKLSTESVEQFATFICSLTEVRFLGIDGVFASRSLTDFAFLMAAIPTGNLWGLSVCGTRKRNFSTKFTQFTNALEIRSDIRILHVDGQRMTDSDSSVFIDYLKRNDAIREVSCDSSSISNATELWDFYSQVKERNLAAIGRPNRDITRLMASGMSEQIVSNDLDAFRKWITTKHSASSKMTRSHYICRIKPGDDLDVDELHVSGLRCPKISSRVDDVDDFYLAPVITPIPSQGKLPALLMPGRETREGLPLGDLQNAMLASPMSAPHYYTMEGGHPEEDDDTLSARPHAQVEEECGPASLWNFLNEETDVDHSDYWLFGDRASKVKVMGPSAPTLVGGDMDRAGALSSSSLYPYGGFVCKGPWVPPFSAQPIARDAAIVLSPRVDPSVPASIEYDAYGCLVTRPTAGPLVHHGTSGLHAISIPPVSVIGVQRRRINSFRETDDYEREDP